MGSSTSPTTATSPWKNASATPAKGPVTEFSTGSTAWDARPSTTERTASTAFAQVRPGSEPPKKRSAARWL